MSINFITLAKQNSLTFDEEQEHFYIKPLSRHEYTTYPLPDLSDTILVTLDEYLGLRANYYQFTEDLRGLELYTPKEAEEEHYSA